MSGSVPVIAGGAIGLLRVLALPKNWVAPSGIFVAAIAPGRIPAGAGLGEGVLAQPCVRVAVSFFVLIASVGRIVTWVAVCDGVLTLTCAVVAGPWIETLVGGSSAVGIVRA